MRPRDCWKLSHTRQPSRSRALPALSLFILLSLSLYPASHRVVKAIPLSTDSHGLDTVVDIERLHHGDFFGEEALFRDISVSGFQASLVSETFVEALVISPDLFKSTIKFWPTLRYIKEYSITKQAARDTIVLQSSIAQARNWEEHKRGILSVTCPKTFKADPPRAWDAPRAKSPGGHGRAPKRPAGEASKNGTKSPRVAAVSPAPPPILQTRVWKAPEDEQNAMSKTT